MDQQYRDISPLKCGMLQRLNMQRHFSCSFRLSSSSVSLPHRSSYLLVDMCKNIYASTFCQ